MTICPDCEAGRTCPKHMNYSPSGLHQTMPPTWMERDTHEPPTGDPE